MRSKPPRWAIRNCSEPEDDTDTIAASALRDKLAGCVARFADRRDDWSVFGFETALDPKFARAPAALSGRLGFGRSQRPARLDSGDRLHDVDPVDAISQPDPDALPRDKGDILYSRTARRGCGAGRKARDTTSRSEEGILSCCRPSCRTRCSTKATTCAIGRPCSPGRSRYVRSTTTRSF
jgi:hypothetical protein